MSMHSAQHPEDPIPEAPAHYYVPGAVIGSCGLMLMVPALMDSIYPPAAPERTTLLGIAVFGVVAGLPLLGFAAHLFRRAWERRAYRLTATEVLTESRRRSWHPLVSLADVHRVDVLWRGNVVPDTGRVRIETREATLVVGPFEKAGVWAEELARRASNVRAQDVPVTRDADWGG